jgi:hypothetical protein
LFFCKSSPSSLPNLRGTRVMSAPESTYMLIGNQWPWIDSNWTRATGRNISPRSGEKPLS